MSSKLHVVNTSWQNRLLDAQARAAEIQRGFEENLAPLRSMKTLAILDLVMREGLKLHRKMIASRKAPKTEEVVDISGVQISRQTPALTPDEQKTLARAKGVYAFMQEFRFKAEDKDVVNPSYANQQQKFEAKKAPKITPKIVIMPKAA